MSLKIVNRAGTEILYLRGTVRGHRVFESTKTSDKRKAEEIRVAREAEIWERCSTAKRRSRSFAEAVTSYLEFESRSPATKAVVKRLLDHFKTAPLDEIDQAAADAACRKILSPNAGAATKIRAVYTPLSAIMRHAAVRGMCAMPLFQKPSVRGARRTFFTPSQVNAIIEGCAPHLRPLITFLAGTGARMSEALELEWAQVDLRAARCVVWQKQGNDRYIDMPPRVVAALSALPHRDGHVFRPVLSRALPGHETAPHGQRGKQVGEHYRLGRQAGGGQIKAAWGAALQRAGMPGRWHEWRTKSGQVRKLFRPDASPHTLRHTWASWHYCAHCDILKLKADGGWSTVAMCEKYAKVMPDVYRDEILAWWAGGPAQIAAKTA